jgi:mono/diheme cytochrome c family protein
MNAETKRRIQFWGVAALVAAGVAGVILPPPNTDAARSQPTVPDEATINTNLPLTQAALRVFRGQNCAGCHSLPGVWSRNGVPLDRVPAHFADADRLRRFIRNPKAVVPASLMPAQVIVTDADIGAIADFLIRLPGAATNAISTHEHP